MIFSQALNTIHNQKIQTKSQNNALREASIISGKNIIEISNSQLVSSQLGCFNSSVVNYQGKRLLFYRYTPQLFTSLTQIAFVELDSNLQPISQHCPVKLEKVTDRIVTFDDPRAFVWRDELWIMHTQAACVPTGGFSAAIVLSQINLNGEVIQTHVPNYGRNINYAVADERPAYEKNWTPLVVNDELYLIYEINPLHVIRFRPEDQTWLPVSCSPWVSPYQTYLSGGTPLIPWSNSEYIGLFHTFIESSDKGRFYSMGFYTVDIDQWRVTRISSQPTLVAWSNKYKDIRMYQASPRMILKDKIQAFFPLRRKHRPLPLVVFPCGIVDCGEAWMVSLGWNDCRSYIEIYNKNTVVESLKILPYTQA